MSKKSDTIDLLMKLAQGTLSKNEQHQLRAALAADRELRELYAVVKRLVATSKEKSAEAVSRAVKELSEHLFEDFWEAKKQARKKLGVTIFDSKVLPLPEGVRPATVDTRRIRYRFEDCDLDISLYPISPGSYEIIGQVVGVPEGTVFEVTLKNRKTSLTTKTDEFHVFRFERVEIATYELSLRLGKRNVGAVTITL